MKQLQHPLAMALNRHGILSLQRGDRQQAQQQRQVKQQAVHGFTLWTTSALLSDYGGTFQGQLMTESN